jgi:hypothetical protein
MVVFRVLLTFQGYENTRYGCEPTGCYVSRQKNVTLIGFEDQVSDTDARNRAVTTSSNQANA